MALHTQTSIGEQRPALAPSALNVSFPSSMKQNGGTRVAFSCASVDALATPSTSCAPAVEHSAWFVTGFMQWPLN